MNFVHWVVWYRWIVAAIGYRKCGFIQELSAQTAFTRCCQEPALFIGLSESQSQFLGFTSAATTALEQASLCLIGLWPATGLAGSL